jgi:hypothetical protein
MFEGNAAVSIVNFPTFQNPVEAYRQTAYEAVDIFVERISPHLESDRPLSLEQMSEIFQQERGCLLGRLLEGFIENRYGEIADQMQASCPRCDKILSTYKKGKIGRDLETMQGDVHVERTYFYCRGCKIGFYPLDIALNLSGRKKQYDMQRRALDLIADEAFKRAEHHFESLTGIHISDHCLHDLFTEFTQDLPTEEVLPSREEIERKIEEASAGSARRPIMVVATDGAMAPLRLKGGRDTPRGKGDWKEVKGFRVYLAGKDRIIHLASWHQVDEAHQVGDVLQIMAKRIPHDKVRIALVGDGASWLWTIMSVAFPTGRKILDMYHCWEHVFDMAQVQFANNPEEEQAWVLATMGRLYYARVSDVIRGLHRMKPRNDEAREAIRKLAVYLTNQREKIHYHGDRIGGYPVGSGGIESANKWICHARLKKSGAWWLKENANGMLKLRCAIVNETFQKAFSNHVVRQQGLRFATNG